MAPRSPRQPRHDAAPPLPTHVADTAKPRAASARPRPPWLFSPLLLLLPTWRRAVAALLAVQLVWLGLSSLRTEFGVLQQAACQSALWTDSRVRVVAPLRLSAPLPEAVAGELRQRVRNEDADACVPRTLDASTIAYPKRHAFYDSLRTAQRATLPPPPIFNGSHASLCNEFRGAYSGWDYCLPITGRKDEPHCAATDRMDLLRLPRGERPCFGSALHMLLVDVYEEIQRVGGRPAVLFGTLLGAVRAGSTIPFTEDADVGYVCHESFSLATLREALRALGYHLFYQGVWRVCVAPTHPLAPVLYDPNMTSTRKHKVPYVDLYAMSPDGADRWFVEKMEKNRRIPRDKFEPYAQVELNGMAFNTVADPVDFLLHEYGQDYLTPKPRTDE